MHDETLSDGHTQQQNQFNIVSHQYSNEVHIHFSTYVKGLVDCNFVF